LPETVVERPYNITWNMYKSSEIFLAPLKFEQTMGHQVRNLAAFIELNSLLVLQETALVYDFADMLLSLVIISAAVLCGLHMPPLSKHDRTGTKLCAIRRSMRTPPS
jgi:hypothetical protein